MVSKFLIDNNQKKKLLFKILKANSDYILLYYLKNFFHIIAFIFPIAFLIYAYLISNDFVWSNNFYGAEGNKNHLMIWTIGFTLFILLWFFSYILKLVFVGLAGKTINERIDEVLFIENDILQAKNAVV